MTKKLGAPCSEPECDESSHARSLCRRHYRKRFGQHWSDGNPEHRRARERARTHKRKAVGRYSDITPAYEIQLRRKTRRCPLCRVWMVSKPYLPNSKELDHIVPLNMGGTHTIGNVRIICRDCNLKRPKDGSDYSGPVTLWAQQPGVAVSKRRRSTRICEHGVAVSSRRCYTCKPRRMRSRTEDGRLAAKLRADGLSWQDITDRLGFTNPGGTYIAAQMHGDPADVARWPTRYARSAHPHRYRQVVRDGEPTPPPPRIGCVDCGDPVVTRMSRCTECWTEINESDAA